MNFNNFPRDQYQTMGIKPEFPYNEIEGRSVGHITPELAYKIGFSPENTAGGIYPYSFIANLCEKGETREPVTCEEYSMYIRAAGEMNTLLQAMREGNLEFNPSKTVSWRDIPTESKVRFLQENAVGFDRAKSAFHDNACKILEQEL